MKRLLKLFSITSLLTLLRMIFGFVIAKVVAIYAGPSGMAMLGQFQGVISVFNGLVNASVSTGVIKYTSENNESGYAACSPWWRASLYFSISIICIIIPIAVLFSEWLSYKVFKSYEYNWLIILAALVLPLNMLGTLFNAVINGQQNYRRFVILGIVSLFFSTSLMLSLIYHQNIEGALIAAAVQNSIIGVVMLVSSINQPWLKVKYWFGYVEIKYFKGVGSYFLMGITTALSVPVSLLLVRTSLIDVVGLESAGHWQAVWKISEVYLSVITIAFGTYYLPRLSAISKVDAIKKEIRTTLIVLVPIVITAAFLIYVCRDFVITVLFTESFRAARELFSIQLAGDVFKIIGVVLAYPMLSHKMTKRYISSEILFSLLFVYLSINFIDNYGVQGANIAYLLTYFLYALCMYFNIKFFMNGNVPLSNS